MKFFLNAEATSFKVVGGSSGTNDSFDAGDVNNKFAEAEYSDEDIPF